MVVRVNLVEISPTGGINRVIEMPAVPREGESIALDPGIGAYTVRSVIWTPFPGEYDVQVRFR